MWYGTCEENKISGLASEWTDGSIVEVTFAGILSLDGRVTVARPLSSTPVVVLDILVSCVNRFCRSTAMVEPGSSLYGGEASGTAMVKLANSLDHAMLT